MCQLLGSLPCSVQGGRGPTPRLCNVRTARWRSRALRLSCKTSVDVPVAVVAPAAKKPNSAHLRALKFGSLTVMEAQRPLAEYMTLPASQYSVLDAQRIERLDDETFRCYVGKLRFISWEVEPVLTVSVRVEDKGCTISLLSCRLQGSSFVDIINERFQASMTNRVQYRDSDSDGGAKEITSDTVLEVHLQVPDAFSFIPISQVEGVGNSVLQATLNLMVPRFLKQLQQDYSIWAAGDTSRKPVASTST